MLKDHKIVYYKKENIGKKAQGCLNFNLMKVTAEIVDGNKPGNEILKYFLYNSHNFIDYSLKDPHGFSNLKT